MAENRRNFMTRAGAGAATLMLSGCASLSQQKWVANLLSEVEILTRHAQRLFAGSHALAPVGHDHLVAQLERPDVFADAVLHD